MPTFEIPDGPTTVELKRTGDDKTPGPATGSVVFNVTNKSTDVCAGRLSVQVAGPTKAEWFTVAGDRERNFAAGETQTANVQISVPKEVGAGEYPFRLRVVAVNDPDNDHTEGPVTTAKLAGAGVKPPPSKLWLWILLGVVLLIAIGTGLYFAFSGHEPKQPPAPPENVVTATDAKVPNFVGQSVDSIAADAGGFQIIKNETANTGHPPRQVYAQEPAADAPPPADKRIILNYEPGVVVPDLPSNATFSSAPNILRSAGLEPGSFICDPSSGHPGAQVGKVTAFSPAPRTRVAWHSNVNMQAVQSGVCLTRFITDKNFARELTIKNAPAISKLKLGTGG
jgi:hypothetical protein